MITCNTIQSSLIFSDSPTSGNEVFLVFMKEAYFPKLESIGKKSIHIGNYSVMI